MAITMAVNVHSLDAAKSASETLVNYLYSNTIYPSSYQRELCTYTLQKNGIDPFQGAAQCATVVNGKHAGVTPVDPNWECGLCAPFSMLIKDMNKAAVTLPYAFIVNSTSYSQEDSSSGLAVGEIVGLILGGVAAVILCILSLVYDRAWYGLKLKSEILESEETEMIQASMGDASTGSV